MNKYQRKIHKQTKKIIKAEIETLTQNPIFRARQCGKTFLQMQILFKIRHLSSKSHYRSIRKQVRKGVYLIGADLSNGKDYSCESIVKHDLNTGKLELINCRYW